MVELRGHVEEHDGDEAVLPPCGVVELVSNISSVIEHKITQRHNNIIARAQKEIHDAVSEASGLA